MTWGFYGRSEELGRLREILQRRRWFFARITGNAPYPYQAKLGTEAWPGVLDIPTGLGKTAAVVVAWLWKRLNSDPETPRRLVYCLPMRVLVEQTVGVARTWSENVASDFEAEGQQPPSVHTLMGGQVDTDWRRTPEGNAILVGTQDMLMSRALMRGYGMSRYQWPIDFALLHNDVLWAFDEVQLMGPALATSAQLEAFRRDFEIARSARSLWMSATLQPSWLSTVDFDEHASALSNLGISDADRAEVGDRLGARKTLVRSSASLGGSSKTALKGYLSTLASEVIARHRPGSQTLVIVNRVDRAQRLFKRIRKEAPELPALLLHARFRAAERREIEEALRAGPQDEAGRIVIATQAVEAGVDITSTTLFTELAPWSSMVQRFGRCNRYGELPDGATVVWMDLKLEGKDAAPYEAEDLDSSRSLLENGLQDVGPEGLPPVTDQRPLTQVLRRRDLLDLFNTDPDLSGFDIDVSPYIRDAGTSQIQVYWRVVEGAPDEDQPRPTRDELCNVSMGQIRDYLKRSDAPPAWVWDPLGEQWAKKRPRDSLIPGSTLLLDAKRGGYDEKLGFDAPAKSSVSDLRPEEGEQEAYPGDPDSRIRRFIELSKHLDRVAERARELVTGLPADGLDPAPVVTAAAWHDVGKAHPAFQTAILDAAVDGPPGGDGPWAKSPGRGRLNYRIDGDPPEPRPYFRHELASMLAWLEHGDPGADADLIAYLILAHHGKVRMGLRALPKEAPPPDDRLMARGVWDGDELPPVEVDGRTLPATVLHLDLMRLGRGDMGPSWIERTQRLLEEQGPFVLAWLETLVRLADWRASAEEDSNGS